MVYEGRHGGHSKGFWVIVCSAAGFVVAALAGGFFGVFGESAGNSAMELGKGAIKVQVSPISGGDGIWRTPLRKQLPRASTCGDATFRDEMKSLGGAATRLDSRYRVVVQSVSPKPILIDGVKAKIVTHRPGDRNVKLATCASGGYVEKRTVMLDLAGSQPAEYLAGEDEGGAGSSLSGLGLSLTNSESSVFDASMSSSASTDEVYEWHLMLAVTVEGKTTDVDVNKEMGMPSFTTSLYCKAPLVVAAYDETKSDLAWTRGRNPTQCSSAR